MNDAPALISSVEWRLVGLGPGGRIGLGFAIAVAVLALSLSWRNLRAAGLGRRVALFALYTGAVAMALVLFFQPAVEIEDVSRNPNHVAILVDASSSMHIAASENDKSRTEAAASFLDARKDAIARLAEGRRVDLYTFGANLAASSSDALKRLDATEPATQLMEALVQLRARYDGHALAGVIVLSDGADNGRLASTDAKASPKELAALDVPMHTVRVGDRELHDLAVSRVMADDFAFVRTAITIETTIRESGGSWPVSTLPVTLLRDGEAVRTVEVSLEERAAEHKVSFSFTPDRVGSYLYEISIPTLAGDAIAQNNVRRFVLRVVRDKIRVLQVAGRPSWDERFLRGLLKRDPNVDLISFFILRTLTDVESVSQDELSLIPFPMEELFREQLRSFDVIFMQNFNFGPYGVGQYLDEIKQYVEEGGGLAMVGGDLSFTSGGYAGTPVADVLPVELLTTAAGSLLIDEAPYRLQLTEEGKSHPVTAIETDALKNSAKWNNLPELDGCNRIARARPGTSVLATHPKLVDEDHKPLPIIVAGDAKKGRTLAVMSDSSWHWGFGAPPVSKEEDRGRSYQRFWDGAIRWLIQDPALAILKISTDSTRYSPEAKPKVTVRALSADYRPAARTPVKLALFDAHTPRAQTAVPLRTDDLATDEQGEAHLELGALKPGGYRLVASAELSGRHVEREEIFVVEDASRELEAPSARDDLLRLVAESTGGTFGDTSRSLDDLKLHPPPVTRVNSHRSIELWSGWWTLALAAGFLAAYWTLRRRWGLA